MEVGSEQKSKFGFFSPSFPHYTGKLWEGLYTEKQHGIVAKTPWNKEDLGWNFL